MTAAELAAALAHAEAELDQSDPGPAIGPTLARLRDVPRAATFRRDPTPTIARPTPPPAPARPTPPPAPARTLTHGGAAINMLRRSGYSDERIARLLGR